MEKVDLERRNRSAISCRDPIFMYRHFLFNLFLSRLIHPKGGGPVVFGNSVAGSPSLYHRVGFNLFTAFRTSTNIYLQVTWPQLLFFSFLNSIFPILLACKY